MMTFKELIGYDLHVSRLAFESQGDEIVLVQDFCLLKRRMYVNGELALNRRFRWLRFDADAEFTWQGKHYRFITRTVNYFSMKQDVTIWVDGREIGRTIDPFYAGLPIKKQLHAVIGMAGIGGVVGAVVAALITILFGG